MSDAGYILLHRAALSHGFFRRSQHSEFEAWVWLLSEASWKPTQRRLGEHLVQLDRGQLVVSIRFLMKAWGWSQHKTERFMKRLSDERMVATQAATGITIITVCNYDKYQTGGEATATDAATGSATPSATGSATKKEIHLNTFNTKKEGSAVALVFESDWPKDFREEFWREYPKRVDKNSALKKLEQIRRGGEVPWVVLIGGVRRYAGKVRGKDPTYTKGPAAWLNAGKWDDEESFAASVDDACPPDIYRNVL